MSGINYDFIMKTGEFQSFGEDVVRFSKRLEDTLNSYYNYIEGVVTYGVSSGSVHDALYTFKNYVLRLKNIAMGIGSQMNTLLNDYITTVEQTDQYLYDAGTKVTKDYSEEEYEKLRKLLKSPIRYLAKSDGGLITWGSGVIAKILTKLNQIAEWFNLDIKNIDELLLQANKVSLDGLTQLFDAENELDSYYSSYFKMNYDAMRGVYQAIHELNDLFTVGDSFTTEAIRSKLDPLYAELCRVYSETKEIRTVSSAPNVDEISSFAEHEWSRDYFEGCAPMVDEFAKTIDISDGMLIALYESGEYFKDRLIYGDPDAYRTRQMLLEQLKEMADVKLYSDGEMSETVDNLKTLLGYYEKWGSDYYKYANKHRLPDGSLLLDGRTIPAKELKAFNEALGNVGDILKYADKSIDFIARALADYSAGLELLDSLEANYGNDERISDQINEIRDMYNNSWKAWFPEALREAEKTGFNVAYKMFLKSVFKKSLSEVNAVLLAIEAMGKVTGGAEEAKGVHDFMILQPIFETEMQAYKNALDKLRNADPSDPEYAALAKDASNCFGLAKDAASRIFEAMAAASGNPDQKSYYKYCLQQVKRANMYDTGSLTFLSFEEFMAIT